MCFSSTASRRCRATISACCAKCSLPARNSGAGAGVRSSPCSSMPRGRSHSRPVPGKICEMTPKLPHSVLVVVHTAALEVLLLERAGRRDYWQSVTGSLDRLDEPPEAAAEREVREETGIDA